MSSEGGRCDDNFDAGLADKWFKTCPSFCNGVAFLIYPRPKNETFKMKMKARKPETI